MHPEARTCGSALQAGVRGQATQAFVPQVSSSETRDNIVFTSEGFHEPRLGENCKTS